MAQKVFPKRNGGDKYLLTVKANTGSIDVEYPVGASWVVAQSIALDGAFEVAALSQVRITPVGDAEYAIQ